MKLFKVIIILSSVILLTNCSSSGEKVKFTPAEVEGSILSDYMPTPITLGEGYKAQLPAYFWNGIQYLRFSLRTSEKMLHQQSVYHALNNTKNGEVTSWYSKKRLVNGKVRVIHSYPISGGVCRTYQALIKVKGLARHMTNNACKHHSAVTWAFLK